MTENGEKGKSVADQAVVILIARLMTIFGIPVAGFIAAQMYYQFSEMNTKLTAISERIFKQDTSIALMEQKQTSIEQRQIVSEQRFHALDLRLIRAEDAIINKEDKP
jgi:hypothetical protein